MDQLVDDLELFADTYQEPLQAPKGGAGDIATDKAKRAPITKAARRDLIEKIGASRQALDERIKEFGKDSRLLMVGLLGFAILVFVAVLALVILMPSDQRVWTALGGATAEGGLIYFLVRQIGIERERTANLYKFLATAEVLDVLKSLVQGLEAPEALTDVVRASAELVKTLQAMPTSRADVAEVITSGRRQKLPRK